MLFARPSSPPAILNVLAGASLLLGAFCLTIPEGLAFAPESDLMKIKGYSPEVILATDQQRSRQEWRNPTVSKRSPTEKFFHNLLYGNWTAGIDDFGNQVIRQD